MANKHISEDEIKYIISAESSKAQQAIHALTKATKVLQKEEKERKNAMIELEAQGKKDTDAYRNLQKECKEYSKKISDNKKLIEEQTKKLDINALTMSQLKKRAKDLQAQLDNTSRAANPHEYAALEKQLGTVRSRMDALKTAGKNVEQSLGSIIRTNGAVATFLGNIYTRVSMFVMDTLHGMKEFSNEGIRMAASADGVSRAFDKLNQPNLLAELRKATKGTVNDLELMKATTMSDFFRIPLGDLAKYLQFAQIRAQQTGQSVEYMTNSIVTGLGRQSLKILDNLGLSAAEINEEVAKTGDFMKGVANIVDRELVKAGENYISAADKAAARTVELQNKQMELGKTLLPVKGQWASLTHTIKMGLSDATIWMAKHSDSIYTAIKVITGLVIITKAISAAHAAWNALLIAGRTLTLLHAAAVANSTGNLIRYNAAMKLYNITAAQGSIITKACTAGTLLYSAAKAALTGNIVKARIAMQAFSAVTKITPWGAAAAGIGLIVTAFILLKKGSNEVDKSISNLNRNLEVERTNLNNLFTEIKKTNAGTSERTRMVNLLNDKYPNLITNYNLEKASLNEITRAQNEANAALTNRIATEMKAKTVSDYIGKNISRQLDIVEYLMVEAQSQMGGQVFSKLQPALKAFLNDSTKDIQDFWGTFGKFFHSTLSNDDMTYFRDAFISLRDDQKALSTGIDEINQKYEPYLKTIRTSITLTDEELKQQVENSSILKGLEKEKEKVQSNWLEDTKQNIILKNKELERLDAEIKKYQELGKVKADKSDPNAVSLKNMESTHAAEVNEIRLSGQQKQQTEEEINLAILTSDKTYYTKRIAELEKFKATEKKSSKQAEYQKQIVDDKTKLLNTEIALEKQSIATIEKLRADDLANESETTKAYELHYTKELGQKKITKEQFEMLMLSLDYSSAETRLAIEQRYLNDVNDLELQNGQLKSDAVKRANDAVIAADQSAANARAAQQIKLDDLTKDFKSQFKVTTVDEDHDAQKAVLEASYLARKKMAEKENIDTAALDAAYKRAAEQLEFDHQSRIQSIKEQYGISTQQERLNSELLQLKNALDQKLIVEEDYEKAVKNLKRDSYKQQFDYYSDLFAGAVNALQQAEMDNVDAKYDAEIEAAQGNAEEVERLETEKAQKKLDIEKKYADINFAIKASQIIADTAVSIMKAIADLGPIAGPIAAALMGVTGAAQLVSANAERQKVKNMTLSGSKSSKTGTRVATGRESGGSIDVRRAQDGKFFPAADYSPDARGFIDRPTVIVGEGPTGQSKEWVASNAAVQNPTVAPILNLLDKAQQAGTIRTLDLNQAIRANMAGYSSGGSISQSITPPASTSPASTNFIPAPLMEKLANAIISIDENGVSAPVVLSELERKQELRNRSRNIGSKQ